MFTQLLITELWRKKLESNGFKVILEPYSLNGDNDSNKEKKETSTDKNKL